MERVLCCVAFVALCGCEEPFDTANDWGEAEAARRPSAATEDTGEEEDVRPGTCDPARFPTGTFIQSCCQHGDSTWHSGSDGLSVQHRTYGAPCRDAAGGTNCGVGSVHPVTGLMVQCTSGPCGTNDWRMTLAGGDCPPNDPRCLAHVFMALPVDGRGGGDPELGRCGWEATGIVACQFAGCEWNGEDTLFAPEPYEHQPVYGSLTGTCPYTRCRVGGEPF